MTSVLHWRHIKKDGIIRKIDMMTGFITFSYGTYTAIYIIPNIKYIWYYSGSVSIGVFVLNEMFFLTFIEKCRNKKYMQYQSVIVHMIFLHILPTFANIYCMINGKKI